MQILPHTLNKYGCKASENLEPTSISVRIECNLTEMQREFMLNTNSERESLRNLHSALNEMKEYLHLCSEPTSSHGKYAVILYIKNLQARIRKVLKTGRE
jgi:hypothetical protein